MLESLIKGVWVGLCVAVPLGPIGTLVLKQYLQSGFKAGLASGSGAALADLCYGMLAVAGVRLVASYERPVALVGGLLLLGLAWGSWRESPRKAASMPERQNLIRKVIATFLLTLSNPVSILAFAALIASVAGESPAWFVVGIFSGSMLWWLLLGFASSKLAPYVSSHGKLLGRIVSLTLLAFGIRAIIRGLR